MTTAAAPALFLDIDALPAPADGPMAAADAPRINVIQLLAINTAASTGLAIAAHSGGAGLLPSLAIGWLGGSAATLAAAFAIVSLFPVASAWAAPVLRRPEPRPAPEPRAAEIDRPLPPRAMAEPTLIPPLPPATAQGADRSAIIDAWDRDAEADRAPCALMNEETERLVFGAWDMDARAEAGATPHVPHPREAQRGFYCATPRRGTIDAAACGVAGTPLEDLVFGPAGDLADPGGALPARTVTQRISA